MTSFPHRLMGAAVFDVATYEEVEHDSTATAQAFAIVLLSSLAIGVGATGFSSRAWSNLFLLSAAAVAGWMAWALVTLSVGGRLLPEPDTEVDVGELLRTLGFSTAPGLLCVVGIFPILTIPVFAITVPWMLASMIVAVRQALDYHSTMRAIGVCVLGWLLAAVVFVVMGVLFAPRVS